MATLDGTDARCEQRRDERADDGNAEHGADAGCDDPGEALQ